MRPWTCHSNLGTCETTLSDQSSKFISRLMKTRFAHEALTNFNFIQRLWTRGTALWSFTSLSNNSFIQTCEHSLPLHMKPRFSSRSSSERYLEINILQVTCRQVLNKFLEVKNTKRGQRTIETVINNYSVKERAFYCSNERFVSNITGYIIFLKRSSEHLRQNISQATCRYVRNT